jgi:hypothetical protein
VALGNPVLSLSRARTPVFFFELEIIMNEQTDVAFYWEEPPDIDPDVCFEPFTTSRASVLAHTPDPDRRIS